MLIDARHPEETRVAVVNGQRIEEFDFEAADRKQLKGNIYLAKVTRVEPSLQAAFVEYGGNRHGFLAFSEIHPDYYQIPREDREALLAEEAEAAAEHEAEQGEQYDEDSDEILETGGQHDEPSESLSRKRQFLRRRYKIQEVIRRRQVLLIQVVKEERGSKGAALTTYLSLAGRYCVLMPNTAHGGGISRKIANPVDRRRLKSVMADLQLPQGMGAIVRTAGLKRSADDIRRDFDYLTRLWDEIREKTLGSTAPSLIHQDSDLIKRAIRDIYNRNIEQILVEGTQGFEAAHRFMSMLMPAHAAKVVEYEDNVPLFQRFGAEQQLEGMYQPVVQLKSGGYIVINPTEALVSIDINSGRSTREYGIEETATKTNLEAAEEIGRQLRLRDMAGLVVIDFIDMENSSNTRKVERAVKEAMKNDRARVQIGRISSFGLMEMSRQRLRTGVLEASTHICPMCEGTGMVRSISSAALAALRALEAEALNGRACEFKLRASNDVAVYILNKKRVELAELEELYGVTILTVPDENFIGPNFIIDQAGPPPSKRVDMRPLPALVRIEDDPDDLTDGDFEDDDEGAGEERAERGEGRSNSRRGGRSRGGEDRARGTRGTRRRRERDPADETGEPVEAADDARGDGTGDAPSGAPTTDGEDAAAERGDRKRRRRGRRGKGGRTRDDAVGTEAGDADAADSAPAEAEAAPARPARGRRRKPADGTVTAEAEAPVAEGPNEEPAAAPKPKRASRRKPAEAAQAAAASVDETASSPAAKPAPKAAKKPAAARKPAAAKSGAAKTGAAKPGAAKPAAAVAAPKPVRKAASKAALAAPEVAVAPAADTAEAPAAKPGRSRAAKAPAAKAAPEAESGAGDSSPRKGWWQRTFG